jgi:hypothetical protein
MIKFIPVLFVLLTVYSQQNTLKGEIFGVLGPGQYIVTEDIVIPPDKTLTLRSGTVLLFDGFFTFTVKGGLVAEGTEQNRIIFTSIKDEQYGGKSPEAMDWNHIEIATSASSISLTNTSLFYTTDGIVSSKGDIKLMNVSVHKSGMNRISITGQDLNPSESGFYTHGYPRTPVKPDLPLTPEEEEEKHYLRWIISGGIVASIVAIAVYYLFEEDDDEQPEIIKDPPPPPSPNGIR